MEVNWLLKIKRKLFKFFAMPTLLYLGLSNDLLAEEFAHSTECKQTEKSLQFECLFVLEQKNTRVSGAEIMMSASMPSMRMAHNFKSVPLLEVFESKGIYKFTFSLDMHGVWELAYDIYKPKRTRVFEKLRFEKSGAVSKLN